MSGVKFLLDSNIVIGLVNGNSPALELLNRHQAKPGSCAYSGITRIEVLGWSEITQQQEAVITELLAGMTYLSVTEAVENITIYLRRTRKIKLPDAIIAATAQVYELELLTLDDELRKAVADR